jgi:hypothetical protein
MWLRRNAEFYCGPLNEPEKLHRAGCIRAVARRRPRGHRQQHVPLATPSSTVRNQALSGKPRLAIIALLTGCNHLGPYVLCSINTLPRRFLLIAPLRRLLAIVVSLSVQWAALGGTCVACTDKDMAAAAVGEAVGTGLQRVVATQAPAPEPAAALVEMPEARGIAGKRSENRHEVSTEDRHEGSTSPCCASEAPRTSDSRAAPCGMLATCVMLMMPVHAGALSVARGVMAPLLSNDDLAPPAPTTAPDAPPPRA